MALEIIHPEENDVPNYKVNERYCLTEPDEDGAQRLVIEGDPDGRWLYAIPGQEIPWAEAQKYGLVDGEDDAADEGGTTEVASLAERIGAVASHAQANELAAELGVEGFEEKKPGLEAKKAALSEAAKAAGENNDDEKD